MGPTVSSSAAVAEEIASGLGSGLAAEPPASQPRVVWDWLSPCTAPTTASEQESPSASSVGESASSSNAEAQQLRRMINHIEDLSDDELAAAQQVRVGLLSPEKGDATVEADDIWEEKEELEGEIPLCPQSPSAQGLVF